MDTYTQPLGKKATPPSALLIFPGGLDELPMIVPNGGNEDLDELIVIERRIAPRDHHGFAAGLNCT